MTRKKKSEKPPTLKAVAESAGVSHMTVSRVYSGTAPVSQKTRDTVLRVAAEMGYSPHPLASGLMGGRTRTIGFLWSLLGHRDRAMITREVAALARQRGLLSFTAEHGKDRASLIEVLQRYQQYSVDAVMIDDITPLLDDAKIVELLQSFPVVIATAQEEASCPFDLVILDRRKAMGEVAVQLLQRGRKHIAWLSQRDATVEKKTRAMKDAVRAAGFPARSIGQIEVAPKVETPALAHYIQALERHRKKRCQWPDAILCDDDTAAFAVMGHLHENGISVPDDCAVIGFNNSELCSYAFPALASFDRRNAEQIGAMGAMLDKRLENPHLPPMRDALEVFYVSRASDGFSLLD